jgi:hypothetical protein
MGGDLMDRFEAVLPRITPADEARQILAVMAQICRAASVAAFIERDGVLRWLAGDLQSREVVTAIRGTWGSQHSRVLTGTAFTEPGAPGGEIPVRSWLLWMRRPEDGGLYAVYFAGPDLRPLDDCSVRLMRLAALLVGCIDGFRSH